MQGEGTRPRIKRLGTAMVCKHTTRNHFVVEAASLRVVCKFQAVRPDEVTSCDFHDLRKGSMTLQEYLQSVMKLRARAPNVVKGINLGPC